MKALLFLERAVVQGPGAQGKGSAVGAFELALVVEKLKILADSDERGAKALRKVPDENPAFGLEQLEDFAPALFTEHGVSRQYPLYFDLFRMCCFYYVFPTLT
jgi:hypothetical protein